MFRSVFPIRDFNGTSELVFVSYNFEKPKYDVEECRQRGMTYAAPIKVTTQLMVYDVRDGGERIVRDIKEQEVYFGEIPLMTDSGTFIINGTERVVVSSCTAARASSSTTIEGKTTLERQAPLQRPRHSLPRLVARLRVRPQGPHLYVRIDRRRKMHATVLLRALGYNDAGAAQLLLR